MRGILEALLGPPDRLLGAIPIEAGRWLVVGGPVEDVFEGEEGVGVGRHTALESRQPVIDTLVEARQLYPGQRNSLDALCKRFEIDNSNRELHGALLDAQLLGDVYLAMTGGQIDIGLAGDDNAESGALATADLADHLARAGRRPRVMRASEAERSAHAAYLEMLADASGGRCLWQSLDDA